MLLTARAGRRRGPRRHRGRVTTNEFGASRPAYSGSKMGRSCQWAAWKPTRSVGCRSMRRMPRLRSSTGTPCSFVQRAVAPNFWPTPPHSHLRAEVLNQQRGLGRLAPTRRTVRTCRPSDVATTLCRRSWVGDPKDRGGIGVNNIPQTRSLPLRASPMGDRAGPSPEWVVDLTSRRVVRRAAITRPVARALRCAANSPFNTAIRA